jgi:hypothetical protein
LRQGGWGWGSGGEAHGGAVADACGSALAPADRVPEAGTLIGQRTVVKSEGCAGP